MASSTDNNAWEEFFASIPSPGAALSASLSQDSQSLNPMALLEPGDSAEAQNWFSNAKININNLATIMEKNTPTRPSAQKSSKMLGDAVSPRRSSQLYVSRAEFVKEIRGLMEKMTKLQKNVRDVQAKLQMVASNHERLSRWTIDIEGAITGLGQQFVEKLGLPMAEEDGTEL